MEVVQLFPQKGNVDLHIVVLGIGFIPPQLEDQILLGEDHFPAPHQQLQHIKFLPAEPDGPLSAAKLKGIRFQPQIAVFQILRGPLLRLTPGQHPDASQQFLGFKGLGEVVVRTAVQPLHPVRKLRTGREHQHWDGFPRLPQRPQNGKSVLLRQHHI